MILNERQFYARNISKTLYARGGEFSHPYSAPVIEVMDIAVEKGFGDSDYPLNYPDYNTVEENNNGDY